MSLLSALPMDSKDMGGVEGVTVPNLPEPASPLQLWQQRELRLDRQEVEEEQLSSDYWLGPDDITPGREPCLVLHSVPPVW